MHILELNDACLRLWSDQQLLAETSGFALIQRRSLLLGSEAQQQSRLQPRLINTQFWSRLSLDALPQGNSRARTQADLAHAQLLELCEQAGLGADTDVVLATPAHFDRDQLALLLGIVRQTPLRASGLVDMAVAACSSLSSRPPGPMLFLDSHLHRATISRLEVGDDTLERAAVDDVGAVGMLSVQEAIISLIADLFIRETRFDPLHEAQTEQRVYDALPGWLDDLRQQPETVLELSAGRNSYRARLHRDQLRQRLASRYQQLLDRILTLSASTPTTLVLSASAQRLPGLHETLEQMPGVVLVSVDEHSVSRGVLRSLTLLTADGSDSVPFVTRLPAPPLDEGQPAAALPRTTPGAAPAATAPAAVAPVATQATHVLIGHCAYPLPTDWHGVGGDGLAGSVLGERCCRLRAQGHGLRLEPEPGHTLEYLGRPVQAPLYLEPGETVQLADSVVLQPIVLID